MTEFESFCEFTRNAIDAGIIKLFPAIELDELDLAMQFAISKEMEATGNNTFTLGEICELIWKWCGKEVYDRIFEIDAN